MACRFRQFDLLRLKIRMERARFGEERTRAACQLFGNLALDLERVPAAMATAGNGHHDAPLNFEVFGLAWFAQRQRARNRSRLVSQPSVGSPGSRMFTETDAPDHQNTYSSARQ